MRKYPALVIFFCVVATVCHAEERWALLIGIDQYSSDIITPLKGAVSDARALGDALIKYAGFPSENIFCLTSDNQAGLPNLGNIVTKLDYIASKARSGDVFLFFFAGHGVFLDDQNYLLTYESDIRPMLLRKTGLSVEELSAYLAKIQSGNTILLLDACRNSPSAGRGDEDNLMPPGFAEVVSDIEFRATIYACDTGQRAYEYPGRGRGFFGMSLEEALSGKADRDEYGKRDGKVTLGEVCKYLTIEVPDKINRELGPGKTQTPRIDMSGDPRAGDMVLSSIVMDQSNRETGSPSSGETIVPREPIPEKHSAESKASQLSPLEKARQKANIAFSEMSQQIGVESNAEAYGTEIPKIGLMPLTQQEKAAGWIDSTGECYGEGFTPAEARRVALEYARRSAIGKSLGAGIPIRKTMVHSVQDFQQAIAALTQFDSYGKIVEQKEPVWTSDELPVLVYRVALRARVSQEKSRPDPAFDMALRLNRAEFMDAEEMILSITPSQDCYITVFKVLSDHTVLLLDVSEKHTSVMAPGRQTTFLPSDSERQADKHFRLTLPDGITEDIQSIFVIATRDDVPFLPGEAKGARPDIAVKGKDAASMILPTYQIALEELSGWLLSIPLERRAFAVQQYIIKR